MDFFPPEPTPRPVKPRFTRRTRQLLHSTGLLSLSIATGLVARAQTISFQASSLQAGSPQLGAYSAGADRKGEGVTRSEAPSRTQKGAIQTTGQNGPPGGPPPGDDGGPPPGEGGPPPGLPPDDDGEGPPPPPDWGPEDGEGPPPPPPGEDGGPPDDGWDGPPDDGWGGPPDDDWDGPPGGGMDGPPGGPGMRNGRPGGGQFNGGQGGMGGPSGPGGSAANVKLSGAYALVDGSTKNLTGSRYVSATKDLSAVYVANGSQLTLTNPTVETTGATSSNDSSSFFGLNAAIVATKGSGVKVTGGRIVTSGEGANGLFATGAGATASMTGGTIRATGNGGHGVMATAGGALTLQNVDIFTSGTRAGAVATDRGGGTITQTGGTVQTTGTTSPAIYSTGDITVSRAKMSATNAEGAVIEGSNSITLRDTSLTGGRNGAMIYQSFSGDAEGQRGTFEMTGGDFTALTGPLFYVTNTTAVISLQGTKVAAASGVLVQAATGRWGRQGQNGGTAFFNATEETLNGDLTADTASHLSATLQRTTLTGKMTSVALTLEDKSQWTVTGDSSLTTLNDVEGLKGDKVTNIKGNGHTVTYDANATGNRALGARPTNWRAVGC